jgi:hypothetical protein
MKMPPLVLLINFPWEKEIPITGCRKIDFVEALGKNAATSSKGDFRSTTWGKLVSLAREEMNDKDCSPTKDVRKEFEQPVHALWCSLETY